ncbi:hemolysin III family protein [Colwellia sp. 1_MG-2023]|uniref:PAQR family membrane homeostasis protein TrhA n=1 Tax=unclassified Colwellia TaxID=196834 RepID=UPI001C08A173|nr:MULTISPECIES: hemolysin III family protein [unclassified Colwellia]MBU2925547.1 hemolysin III family protein [Colwellia sp. C2M11]MDO6651484.1 hemolysin III family protein [Colwellia sp. 3_MG-2023]MDO6666839.1 hemolysin III family protein [Colwellia sp. 2_MG-2023]MDO6690941.1 hemolysin III family protein [Colwellia sp. 1_MG-2023]
MTSKVSHYSKNEELANTISHGLGALLSLVALFLLLNNSVTNTSVSYSISNHTMRIISFSIYGTSLFALFCASTFYHGVTNERSKKLFKLLDHCAIYLLIAGTYTPLLLLSMKGTLGYSLMAVIWFIALGGIFFKIKFGDKYKKTSLVTYLGMGFISFTIIEKLYNILPSNAVNLLAIGGLVYVLGVFFYVQKKILFNHAIWHLFVLGGATCHFLMIYWYI